MDGFSFRSLAKLAMPVMLLFVAEAQTSQQAGTLTIEGQPDQAALLRMNGKAYVDLESLARITHGSLRFNGNKTILTLPTSATAAETVPQPDRSPRLSEGFLSAEIEALTQIREWRVSLVNAIQNNFPVADNWIGALRRSADAKLQLAVAAATTEPDQKAAELLRNEFTSMQHMSDQFLAMHAKVNYIAPDSFVNNALDQKIMSCEQALASMAATKQFQDEVSCH